VCCWYIHTLCWYPMLVCCWSTFSFHGPLETAYSPAARGSMPCLSGLGEGFFCLGCVGGGNEKRIWDI
jgi:hypothetical protein